jgi:hypothetical protein
MSPSGVTLVNRVSKGHTRGLVAAFFITGLMRIASSTRSKANHSQHSIFTLRAD